MPRVSPSLVRRAQNISPYAATLLPACRDLPSALTELRWIREHVQSTPSLIPPKLRLRQLCEKRGKGIPLQYVMGTQPFGRLDIRCRPGVLIPRPEPEAYTTYLAHLIKTGYFAAQLKDCKTQGLRITDFCSGTGCIALLLYALLHPPTFPSLHVRGVDISPRAVALSRDNARHNVARGLMPGPSSSGGPDQTSTIRFDLGDVFFDSATVVDGDRDRWRRRCDVMVSNPPYVSAAGFARDTARSVRNHEPALAQVPGPRPYPGDGEGYPEDVFYARLLEVAGAMGPPPGIMLFEVGGSAQARRVAAMAMAGRHAYLAGYVVEIWRDWPDAVPEAGEAGSVTVGGEEVVVRGSGHERSVLMYKKAEHVM